MRAFSETLIKLRFYIKNRPFYVKNSFFQILKMFVSKDHFRPKISLFISNCIIAGQYLKIINKHFTLSFFRKRSVDTGIILIIEIASNDTKMTLKRNFPVWYFHVLTFQLAYVR